MKKILCLLLVVILSIGFVGCGTESASVESKERPLAVYKDGEIVAEIGMTETDVITRTGEEQISTNANRISLGTGLYMFTELGRVTSITINSEKYSIARGIHPGMLMSEVEEKYKKDEFFGKNNGDGKYHIAFDSNWNLITEDELNEIKKQDEWIYYGITIFENDYNKKLVGFIGIDTFKSNK